MSILHSFWQAGLLLLFYYLFENFFSSKSQPLHKRNFLFLLITFQLIIFIATFVYYLNHSPQSLTLAINNPDLLFIQVPDRINFITPYVMNLYLLALAYRLIRYIFSWKKMEASLKQNLFKPMPTFRSFCHEKALQFGINRPIKLWLSNHITTPITHGFLKPAILLPIALINQLSTTQVEALILHELSHIKANDYLLNWWMIIVENIFFFNPFIRIACDKIRLEREKACDLQVVNFKYAPLLYAETLLKAQKYQQQEMIFPMAATGAGKNLLLKRIQYFTTKVPKEPYPAGQIGFSKVIFSLLPLLAIALLYALPLFTFTKQGNMLLQYKSAQTINEYPYPSNALNGNTENLASENYPDATIKTQPIALAPVKEKLKVNVAKKAPSITLENGAAEIIPVSLNNQTGEEKIVIVKEEISGSAKTIVKVYKAKNINGEWVLTPDWIATTNDAKDSLSIRNDSSATVQKLQ